MGLLLGLIIISCSENNTERNDLRIPEEGLPVYATLDTRTLPAGLNCHMYVYSRPVSGGTYTYDQVIDLSGTPPHQIQFNPNEISGKSYRFLFVAQPEESPRLSVITGTNWNELRIETSGQKMNEHYYYGIQDKTGIEIASDGNIHGSLSRLVGQVILDMSKINGTIKNPVGIDANKKIASILDRVYEITIEYSNFTKDISFDSNANIVEGRPLITLVKDTIRPDLGDTLQVKLPQVHNRLSEFNPDLNGSVRINGVCGLVSTKKVRVKYTFKYFDTTLLCENNHTGSHTESCYDNTQSLILHLPEETETVEMLSIIPNYFTVNKAGIWFNRIIDLKHSTSFTLDTEWANTPVIH